MSTITLDLEGPARMRKRNEGYRENRGAIIVSYRVMVVEFVVNF